MPMNKHFTGLLSLLPLLLAFGVVCSSQNLSNEKKDLIDVTLTLIHFNDGESKLLNAGRGLEKISGISRFATVVQAIRSESDKNDSGQCHITVSSGDNFLASPAFAVSQKKGIPYYDAMALDCIGIDALAFGNHDFDFGPDITANFIQSFSNSNTVFLASNLDFTNEPSLQALADSGKIAQSTVIKRGNHRFGLIGLTTPNISYISSPRNVRVNTDLVSCIQREVDLLEESGVNKIILLSHLQGIKQDSLIINKLRGIDIVVAGGGDELLANKKDRLLSHDFKDRELLEETVYSGYPLFTQDSENKNVPIVTTRGEYRYVGCLQVSFNVKGEIIAIGEKSGPRRVINTTFTDGAAPDPLVNTQVILPLEQALDAMKKNVTGTSEINLDGNRSRVRSSETPLGNLLADALLWAGRQRAREYNAPLPDIAMINGGSIRAGIGAGTFSELDIFNTLPFSTATTIVENITPRDLKNLLENAYSRIDMHGEIKGASGTGRFAHIAGFSVIYNSARKPGNRVKEIQLNNKQPIVLDYAIVDKAPKVSCATINFLVRGGDEWRMGKGRAINLGTTHRQALADYIKAPEKEGGLNGKISEERYAESATRKIVRIGK